MGVELGAIVAALPASTPFVGPEALERRDGIALPIRLGANESLFGPSAKAAAAMRRAVDEIQLYGDPEAYELRSALGHHMGVSIEHVVLGAGIDELLGLFVHAYANRGDRAVMSFGGYPTMAYQFNAFGIEIVTAPYRHDRNDVVALTALARSSGAQILYLSTPDNPSGSWLTRAELASLLEALPDGCLLLLDEAYCEFGPPEERLTVDPDDPRVVRLRTFSKAYGLAGLRVGYAVGAPKLIRPLDRIRNQFGMGRLMQAGALAALDDQAHVATVVEAVREGRIHYSEIAEANGLRALPSATNFVAIDMGTPTRARAALALLQRQGVFVRMPTTAPLDRCIRVTVGPPAARAAFAAALSRILSEI